MNKVSSSGPRHMLPRWLSLQNAFTQHELSSVKPERSDEVETLKNSQWQYYEQSLKIWNEERSIPAAVDLITHASIIEIDCQDAIDYIKSKISSNSFVPNAVRELVGEFNEQPQLIKHKAINNIKKKLIEAPKDSLLWSELARNYFILGEMAKAENALLKAYYLSSGNRYITRNLSCFYMQKTECDKALFYLRNNPSVRYDPWILSAEIAISNHCERSSRNIKAGRAIIESDNFTYESICELASELGTMEYNNANKKGGKRNLLIAKKALNENSAAQIQWINHNVNRLDDEILEFNAPLYNYEAEIYKQLDSSERDWENIFISSAKWHSFQPFSISPVLWGSAVSIDMLDNAPLSIEILKQGLQCNKDEPSLINNLAYAYVLNNEIDNALIQLDKINLKSIELEDVVLVTATRGLISYRIGDYESGYLLYREAADIVKKDNPNLYARVLAYHAKEALFQDQDISEIMVQLKKCNITEDIYLRDLLKKNKIILS